jgi:hypothetical protein
MQSINKWLSKKNIFGFVITNKPNFTQNLQKLEGDEQDIRQKEFWM